MTICGRFLAFLLFTSNIALCQSSPTSGNISLPEVIASVKSSIVRVQSKFTYQEHAKPTKKVPHPPTITKENSVFGTGFIVDENGHVGTANHVVDGPTIEANASKALTKPGMIFVPGSLRVTKVLLSVLADNYSGDHGSVYDVADRYEAVVYKQDSVWDTAILAPLVNILTARSGIILNTTSGESRGPQKRMVPRFQTSSPREGDDVSVSGFPAVLGNVTGIPGITTNSGRIANSVYDSGQGRFVFLIDMHINHGDSGGPVYENSDGSIIGFMDAYTMATNGENAGLAIVIPIQHVLALLPAH